MAKLTFILDDGETIEVPLHDSVTIGRADGNDVVVYDPRISSRHAELHFLPDGKFEVRDLASKAGTYVNGERVERKMLGHGDQVSFGPLRGEFSTEVVTPGEPPAAADKEREGDESEGTPASSGGSTAAKPTGEPKEKSEKGFLSSVLAAMGAKNVNGGAKSAEAKGGKQERKGDAVPAAKVKQSEKPAQAKAAPGPSAPQSKAAPSAAEPAKTPGAKPPEVAAAPDAGSSAKTPDDTPAAAAPASLAGTPALSPKTPPAESKPAEAKADLPASAPLSASPEVVPSASVPTAAASSSTGEAKPEPPPEAGKPVAWDKNKRQENKPPGVEAPAALKSDAEPSSPSPKKDQPAELAGATAESKEQPPVSASPESSTNVPQEAPAIPVTPIAPAAPASTPTAADTASEIQPAAGTSLTIALPSVSPAPQPATAQAPSRSTTPVVVAAGPALDQKIVNLVYHRLEGEAKTAITALETRQKALDAEVTRLRDEIIRMQAERRTLAQEHSSLRESIQCGTGDLEALRLRHKTAEEEMERLVGTLRQGQERLDKLLAEENQLSHVTAQLAETEARRDQVSKAIEDLTAQGEASRTKFQEEIEGVGAELEAKRVDFQAAMESMKLQAEAARVELQAGIDAAAADADAQRAQIQAELDQLIEETTARRAELLGSIDALAKEEEFRQGEVQRLVSTNEAALREFEAMTSNKEQMSVQLLTLLKEQETHDARLIELRRQIANAEDRARKVQELVEAREDQVTVAERRLQAIEQQRSTLEHSVRELTESENRLKALLPQLQESEAREAALTSTIAALLSRQQECEFQNESLASHTLQLQQELATFEAQSAETRALLEASIAELQQNKQIHSDDHDRFVAETSAVKTSLAQERTVAEQELAGRQAELARETASLQETIAQRQELERQCRELSDTDKKLAEARAGVQKAEAQRHELDTWIKELQSKRDATQKTLDALHHEEEASRGRLEVLRGKEKDLRAELEQLAQKEHEDRVRFEELRRLTTEADREHEAQMEELSRTLELTRRELADMEVKLAPLREWKESMDKRYARLASLPEDSAEARELWKEIEAEKAGLGQLIGVAGKGGTRGVSLNESILRGMSGSGEGSAPQEGAAPETPSQRPGLKGRGKVKLHAPPGLTDAETPEERGNVGPAGTGALLSGTGQEMALRARLSRLRESVQREATRLEFLRQERAREETRKTVSSSNEPMLKEQERQVEVKLRREEEKLATIERKIEIAEMEEEKRRERLAELERKLTELKTDIIEHERSRSEAVRKADLAQVEAKVAEDMAGRARSSAPEHEAPKSDRPSGAVPLSEPRPKLKTMGAPAPHSAPEPMDVPDSEKGMGELLLGKKPE